MLPTINDQTTIFTHRHVFHSLQICSGNDVTIDHTMQSHKPFDKYPAMHNFVTEMCTSLLQNDALWDKGLVHHGICGISANALELLQSCTKPSVRSTKSANIVYSIRDVRVKSCFFVRALMLMSITQTHTNASFACLCDSYCVDFDCLFTYYRMFCVPFLW